ncbi:hypothetical protein [uncultured Arcobacter sp.]|uniref:hypothetical protein n=1 Tax=uncultured Arcobacter sp. TaxID=165434 RepID=UPI002634294E|nr:hypothetical protein [uncultured Arcobacter sp.]
MNKKVYIDQNIYEDILQQRDKKIVSVIQENYYNYDFFYSPAHIEEVTASQRNEKDASLATRRINEKLNNIRLITQNNEFLPSLDGAIINSREEPYECMERVMIDYENTTLLAEKIDNEFLSRQKEQFVCQLCNKTIESYHDFRIRKGIDKQNLKHINDVNPDKLFEQEKVIASLNEASAILHFDVTKCKKWNEIKYIHKDIEFTIQKLYEVLEVLGYKIEKIAKSRMHDITHTIYATASDIFVVEDKKLYCKAKAIYSYLEIPTKVFCKQEFIDYLNNKEQ